MYEGPAQLMRSVAGDYDLVHARAVLNLVGGTCTDSSERDYSCAEIRSGQVHRNMVEMDCSAAIGKHVESGVGITDREGRNLRPRLLNGERSRHMAVRYEITMIFFQDHENRFAHHAPSPVFDVATARSCIEDWSFTERAVA